ncbi:MAG: hypothetical protein HKL90_14045 [Elusimicrobia bacterium]|nr:hypothetical protein [Elusimicrobiota bacterium]
MTPEKCPNCGTKLKPETLSCPNCPMSFPEDDSASAVHPLKQTPLYRALPPILLFAGIGYLIWSMATGLFHLGETSANYDAVDRNAAASGTPASSSASSSTTIAAEVSPPSEPARHEVVYISHEDSVAPRRAAISARAADPQTRSWRLRGVVYDLTTLKPLSGCTIILVDERANRRIETRTDAFGRYRTIVPSLAEGGYVIGIEKDGYAPAYLDSAQDGVPTMSTAQRVALADDMAKTFTSQPATIQAANAAPVRTDFYLAPRR